MKGTALGLVAVILAVLGLITPFAGIFISGLSGLFAVSVYKHRDSYALAALVLNLLNLTLFSPQTLLMIIGPRDSSLLNNLLFSDIDNEMRYLYTSIFGLQIIGLVLYARRNHTTDKTKKRTKIEPTL
ncbi:hypothetical protein [Vibrio aestuarianus]|uniref:Uncharacterized protein n=1 Tax=Vibrio aestuarianus TaxID=28171 RepID=A0ABM9FKT3_9VIBR|nr:hypothetical protein [Vibrio aestuarianus]MDE1229305.1 hypothetical protein [Vibrio aestuarianus]MDE1255206.1 hypothetical protein [Vibrio aestuarianus]MDE1272795.1 hypothetical protein [Vibrio aestuarianus]MDE1294163.1 hypothetical protein [Vibrio aestuarianus]MDE1308308.1 hypothetical protein [Vibrio aestuarianus]